MILWDQRILNPFEFQHLRLENAGFFTEEASMLLGQFLRFRPLEEGCRRFGLMNQIPSDGSTQAFRGRIVMSGPTDLALILDWPKNMSAWDALLESLEEYKPKTLALMPHMILTWGFIAHISSYTISLGDNTAAIRLKLFSQVNEALFDLVHGIFLLWLRSETEGAINYRMNTQTSIPPDILSIDPKADQAVKDFIALLGEETIAQITRMDRIEPAILRGLDTLSQQLWSGQVKPNMDAELLSPNLLGGLLSLALWRKNGVNISSKSALRSLDSIDRHWRRSAGC